MQSSEMYGPVHHVNHVRAVLQKEARAARAQINRFVDATRSTRNDPERLIEVSGSDQPIPAGDVSSFAQNMTMFSQIPTTLRARWRLATTQMLLHLIEEETVAGKTSPQIVEVLVNRLILYQRVALRHDGDDQGEWTRYERSVEARVYSDYLVLLQNGHYPYV